MGNSATKEQRPPQPSSSSRHHHHGPSPSTQPSPGEQRLNASVYASRQGRGSRHDLSFLGIGSNTNVNPPEVRRETKQEREARKLAKERELRGKERERSMKEEHIDGGFCVTQGVYVGSEDFNKAIVRQLMIERRMAPFWRGLETFKQEWTEHQLVAAARGLPIPAADEVPPEDPNRPSPESPRSSTPNLHNLMVPIASRSHSQSSDMNLSPSHPAFSLPSPTSPVNPSLPQSSSPFRPRSKTLASLTSKNPSQSDMVPREIQLPKDPYVNGQMMEAFLYKDAEECPICFIYYPPYLNKTRCCDQPICSECFVQIKRPDPHPPEHADPSNPSPVAEVGTDPEALVSEPANCPYCQQAEFGVTYEPPPFRRGLGYANLSHGYGLGNVASAMSSSSSLNSMGSPTLAPTTVPRRRTTSISANASTVITTDRIRPDWATKLANARNHAARRAAAATALHTAAYLMGNGVMPESRSFTFGRSHRFGRRGADSPGSGSATPQSLSSANPATFSTHASLSERPEERTQPSGLSPGQEGAAGRRRSRMDDLEDMMMLEAIRLSLAAEEERKRKEEKEARKEAKKNEKAEEKASKKVEKAAKKGMYSGNSSASASGSALSLALPSIGRRRGNSGSSAYLREATLNYADKGKSVDRSISPADETNNTTSTAPLPIAPGRAVLSTVFGHQGDNVLSGTPNEVAASSPTNVTAPEKPSHLRQMSNASSPASSFIESVPGSLRNANGFHGSSSTINTPNASGIHIAGTPDRDGDNGSAGTEPMFNFRSLAEIMGREDEKEGADNRPMVEHAEGITYLLGNGGERGESSASAATIGNMDGAMEESIATIRDDAPVTNTDETTPPVNGTGHGNEASIHLLAPRLPTPEVTITPETPVATTSRDEQNKQLGSGMSFTHQESF